MSNERYKENKHILYGLHDYDPKLRTKNVHHIVFRSEGGRDELENLALLDKDTHAFIHDIIKKIDKNSDERPLARNKETIRRKTKTNKHISRRRTHNGRRH